MIVGLREHLIENIVCLLTEDRSNFRCVSHDRSTKPSLFGNSLLINEQQRTSQKNLVRVEGESYAETAS